MSYYRHMCDVGVIRFKYEYNVNVYLLLRQ